MPLPHPHRLLSTCTAAALTLAVTLVGAMLPTTTAGAQSCADVFPPAFQQQLAGEFPGQRATAAVHDTRTGCWYDLAPGTSMQTASVIKAQFLAGTILRAQDQGRGLTPWERDRIGPMMWYSHNPPASDLFVSLGGIDGQERLDARFGLGATTSTNRWGATVSTARDRTQLARQLLHSGGPLQPLWRAEAWRIMAAVHPTQTWGITAGVPEGWSVALKNGFYPTTGTPRWRIGSSGFVRHDASQQGYAVTIMTDQNPDHVSGQRLVERVASRISDVLTDGPAAPRPVDRSRCVGTAAGQSWEQVASALGTADAQAVRIVSGGPEAPLAGMRACRPDLLAPYDPDGASAHYVRALFDTFLERPASEADTEHHATMVDRGALSRAQLTRALATSDEWLDRTIDAIYRVALDRHADADGQAHWRHAIRGGASVDHVTAAVFASDELYRRAGSTAGGFVDELYRRVLGRDADPGGRSHWVSQLDLGTSRAAVAREVHGSVESRRIRVRGTYLSVLDREPDPAGLDHWTRALARLDAVALAATLATSAEYFARAQP